MNGLTEIAINYAIEQNIKTIGISGGVSYNLPIIEIIERQVNKSGLKLIVHNKIPNGDAGISVGQNVIIGHKLNS